MFDEGNGNETHTAFSDAFETATGYTKHGMTLYMSWRTALTKYASKGGNRDELQRIFDRLLSESNLNDDVEAAIAVPQGRVNTSSTSSPSARPAAREPSAGYKAAAVAGAKELAATLLDVFKVRDGRAIGDVRFGELDTLRVANDIEARVIYQIQHHANAAHDAKVRDVVKDVDFRRFVENARRHAA